VEREKTLEGEVILNLEMAGSVADRLGVPLGKFVGDAIREEIGLPPMTSTDWPENEAGSFIFRIGDTDEDTKAAKELIAQRGNLLEVMAAAIGKAIDSYVSEHGIGLRVDEETALRWERCSDRLGMHPSEFLEGAHKLWHAEGDAKRNFRTCDERAECMLRHALDHHGEPKGMEVEVPPELGLRAEACAERLGMTTQDFASRAWDLHMDRNRGVVKSGRPSLAFITAIEQAVDRVEQGGTLGPDN
jgi:hypothetical protein